MNSRRGKDDERSRPQHTPAARAPAARRALGRLLAPACACAARALGPCLVRRLAAAHAPHARPLTDAERRWFARWFPHDMLAAVRLAEPGAIRTAPPWLERAAARLGLALVASPAGLCLGDLVLLASDAALDSETLRERILFHELVHTRQFRRLGLRGFCAEYAAGWARAGFRYADIPLEIEARAAEAERTP